MAAELRISECPIGLGLRSLHHRLRGRHDPSRLVRGPLGTTALSGAHRLYLVGAHGPPLAWLVLSRRSLCFDLYFGMAEAGAYPGATRAIYNWIPISERGLALGLFTSARGSERPPASQSFPSSSSTPAGAILYTARRRGPRVGRVLVSL